MRVLGSEWARCEHVVNTQALKDAKLMTSSPRTRKCPQVLRSLLGSLAGAAPPLYGRGSGRVAPQLLLHAVVDRCDVGWVEDVMRQLGLV